MGVYIMLLLFAVAGYGGGGAILAAVRHRFVNDGEKDFALVAMAGMLFGFGVICTLVGLSWAGVPALGGIVGFVSYAITAERLGLFVIEVAEQHGSEAEHVKGVRNIE